MGSLRIARIMRRGDRGDDVRALQRALLDAGQILPRWGCDGILGSETMRAAKMFARERNLPPVLTYDIPARVVAELLEPEPTVVEGVDVSGWQRQIDWSMARALGDIEFVWVKATEGARHTSPGLARHFMPALDAGLMPGLYHFARLDFGAVDRPIDQADFFCRSPYHAWTGLPPVLDLEAGGIPRELEGAVVVDWAVRWLERVEERLGTRPMIYTGRYTWIDRFDRLDDLTAWRLWQADYDAPSPIPAWPATVVQYTGSGTIPGYDGKIDRNRFNGTIGELAELRGS